MEEFVEAFFCIQLTSTLLMVGVIWVVQLVHYPSFFYVDEKKFLTFSHFHQKRITLIVAPTMLIEFVSAWGLVLLGEKIPWCLNLASIILLWIVTALFFIPLHKSFTHANNEKKIARLVALNWWRTLLWSLRGMYLISLI